MARLVFFDLDGTILGGLSSEKSFFIHLFLKGQILFGRALSYFLFFIKWFPRYKETVLVRNKAYLTGLQKDKIEKMAEKFVSEKLIKRVRPQLRKRIEEHRAVGDKLILITGSPEFLGRSFARHLGMEEVYPAVCVTSAGYFLSDPPTQYPYQEEKLEIAKKVCEKYGANIKDCVAYGNSIHDAFLLEAVGHPVVVMPDKKLHKLAKEKGWEIIIGSMSNRVGK